MYRELNDYEMLYLICDGNDNEFEIMLKKYYPLIIKLASKYKCIAKKMGYEINDLEQVGAMTLYQTANGYNGYKNDNTFYTYFSKSLENAYINLLKQNNTNKKRVLNESISYDNFFPNSKLTYAEIFPDLNTLDLDYMNEIGIRYYNLKNTLEFDLSCILDLKMEGFNNKEIATLLSKSQREIANKWRDIKRKAIYF